MATLSSPTLQRLITSVRYLLNQPDRNNSFWTDEELTDYINEAVRMYFVEVVQGDEGYFTTKVNLDITANVETVPLPTDCFSVKALRKQVSDGWQILTYCNDTANSYSTNGGTSSETYTPYYFFRGNNLVLRPEPNFSQTGGLELEYVQFPDTLINGGDTMNAQVSPVFKQLIEMYAVYKAKVKESLVNGVQLHVVAESNLMTIYTAFKEIISRRTSSMIFIEPFNPEYI